MTKKIVSMVSRVFFTGATLLLALAVCEAIAQFSGYTILRGAYTAGRLLEFSVLLLVLVICMQLRQIRDELRAK